MASFLSPFLSIYFLDENNDFIRVETFVCSASGVISTENKQTAPCGDVTTSAALPTFHRHVVNAHPHGPGGGWQKRKSCLGCTLQFMSARNDARLIGCRHCPVPPPPHKNQVIRHVQPIHFSRSNWASSHTRNSAKGHTQDGSMASRVVWPAE